ncbi:hypothetical protein C8R45DRAFT_936753 [Mycena sanguinolenta]|nr:hypothetical protein C8R45DRAFT_936753 [Mycena sanguinolenta]
MPRQPTVTEIRLENLASCLASIVTVLKELHDAFGLPFVQPISDRVASLIKLVQNVKQNKKECAQLLEDNHQVLYAIINLHVKSETAGTLQKIYMYIKAQQDKNKFKQLFQYIGMGNLVKECYAELDKAKEIFQIGIGRAMFKDIGKMKTAAELMHKELLELISTMSDTNTTSDESLISIGANDVKNSSNSFSLLPPKPKIFHGRETELEDIMKILGQQTPRIAILGGGGMGKTSLARAALHHSDTLARFEQRFFVSAEPATTSVELAALIGLHLGLNPGKDLTRAVVQYLSKTSSCLLILDNLETVWEPIQSRGDIEEFLSLLTDVKHLGLVITMRGTERPAKVHWTRPFLLPLQPLSDDAVQQTFQDITDNSYSIEDFNQLLSFTDNMPLAVDLLAHLVDYEGVENVLTRWETEKTSLLSIGHDRRSSLDASIRLSLSSSRITSDSKELLSLLSILPNGLSDSELVQSKLLIPNILSFKAALLATSLAYQDSNKRLLVLIPVREHIQQFLPPSPSLVNSLCKYFYALLKLNSRYQGLAELWKPVINQITLNLANLQEVLQRGLHISHPDLIDTIDCSISLCSFYRLTVWDPSHLMEHIQHILSEVSDHRVKIRFIVEVLRSPQYPSHKFGTDKLMVQGISHFDHVNDSLLECEFYVRAATFAHYKSDWPLCWQFLHKAEELSKLSRDSKQQCAILMHLASLKQDETDHSAALEYLRKAQQLSELSMDLYHSAIAIHLQAASSGALGNYHQSMVQFERARELLEICGMSEGVIDIHIILNQAKIHLLKSEYAQAQSIFFKIVETTSLKQNAGIYAIALLNISYIDCQIDGAVADIRKNLDMAVKFYNDTAYSTWIVQCNVIEACMNIREHFFDLAQMKFQECLHFPDAEVKSLCLEHLANITAWPDTGEQSRWPVVYLCFACKFQEKLALHKALLFVGDVFSVNEDKDTAIALYTVALEGFTYMDVHQSQAQCMLRLGDLAYKHGDTTAATMHWKTAQPLFKQSSQAKDVAQIDSRLAGVEKAHEKALVALASLEAPTQSLDEISTPQKHSVKAALV